MFVGSLVFIVYPYIRRDGIAVPHGCCGPKSGLGSIFYHSVFAFSREILQKSYNNMRPRKFLSRSRRFLVVPLILVFARRFGFLTAFDARTLIVFFLAQIREDASLNAAALKPLQGAV